MDQATDFGAESGGSELDRLAAFLTEQDEDHDAAADSQADDEERDDGDQANDAAENDEEEESPDNSELYTIKVDGKDKQVTRDELIAMAQKADSSTQRWEEAAKVQRQAEQERQQLSQTMLQAQQLVSQYEQQLQSQLAQFNGINWQQLLDEDPQQYLRVRHAFEATQNEMFAASQQRQQLQQAQEQDELRGRQETIQREAKLLLDAIPEWRDAKVAQAEKAELMQFMEKLGVPRERIATISNHHDVMAYRALWQMAQLRDKQALASKKVKNLPPPPQKSGARAAPAQKQTASKAAFDRARSTGKVDDAAKALSKLL